MGQLHSHGIYDYFPTPPPAPTAVPAEGWSEVEDSENEFVGFPYQRQNFYDVDDELFWAFYINSSEEALCYRTSPDGLNWSAQTTLKDWGSNLWIYYYPNFYNGSVFGLWYDETYDTVDIGFINQSDYWGSGETLVYLRATPLANGSLSSNDWQVVDVIDGVATEMWAPSVCTNSTNYPFIAVTLWVWGGDGGYIGQLYHSSTNDGTWTEHGDFPMNGFAGMTGINDQWISVIPVSAGNVSVQYCAEYLMDGGDFYMFQNYVTHNASDTWTMGGESMISFMPMPDWAIRGPGPFHSEVHIPTIYNTDDIFMVWSAWDDPDYYLYFDTANVNGTWDNGYEEEIANGSYTAAMSIFNDENDIVLTIDGWLWDMPIYTMPMEFDTYTWGNMSELIAGDEAYSYYSLIVSGYEAHSPLGFMWTHSEEEGEYDLYHGWYGEEEGGDPIVEEGTPLWYFLMLIPLVSLALLIFMIVMIRPWNLYTIIIAAILALIGIAFVVMLVQSIAGT